MRALRYAMRGITRLNDAVGRLLSLLVLVIFVLLIAEVFFRYVAGAPKVWTGELTQLLFGVYAVLSGGYLLAHGGHVNVDILYSRLAPRARAAVDVFTSFLFLVFVGALLYFGGSLAWESVSFWERSQSAWDPPIWPVKLAIPLGAALLLLQGLVKLLRDIFVLLGVEKPDDAVPGDRTTTAP
ncbi:MAG TPA: TRAP transporter small permease subunit [Burkholderiales bacterium]|nr:TRAP transporter small permease subunit [Burkholderiales bacterium]